MQVKLIAKRIRRLRFGLPMALKWGYSSVGRASALQAEGQGFKSLYFHCGNRPMVGQRIVVPSMRVRLPLVTPYSPIAQLVEHSAVNRSVASSSLAGRVNNIKRNQYAISLYQ